MATAGRWRKWRKQEKPQPKRGRWREARVTRQFIGQRLLPPPASMPYMFRALQPPIRLPVPLRSLSGWPVVVALRAAGESDHLIRTVWRLVKTRCDASQFHFLSHDLKPATRAGFGISSLRITRAGRAASWLPSRSPEQVLSGPRILRGAARCTLLRTFFPQYAHTGSGCLFAIGFPLPRPQARQPGGRRIGSGWRVTRCCIHARPRRSSRMRRSGPSSCRLRR